MEIFCLRSIAQLNLVPNPSFEDTIMCPDMGGQVARAKYWHSIENTPDYFNACCIFPQFSVPENAIGFQYASTGDAYCGFATYSTLTFYRETIGAILNNPLIVGTKYFVTFKVNFARKEPFSTATICCNKTGILFSTIDYLSSPPPHENFSQIFTDNIVTDTLNWVTIRGSFVADSSYIFISIGNFFDDNMTDTIQFTGSQVGNSYYFVDDVCVSTDSMYSESWTGMQDYYQKNNIEIYPIPVVDKLHIRYIPYGFKQIEIYDSQGKLERIFNISADNTNTIDLSWMNAGMYSLVFRSKLKNKTKRFIKL